MARHCVSNTSSISSLPCEQESSLLCLSVVLVVPSMSQIS